MKHILELLLIKYQLNLDVLKENQKQDTTSDYPYEFDIKQTRQFLQELKRLENKLNQE